MRYILIDYSPIIFINGSYHKGNYNDIENVYSNICNCFEVPPMPCYRLQNFGNASEFESKSIYRFIIYCVSICITIGALSLILLYFIYKKRIRKNYNFMLNTEINKTLSDYYKDELTKNKYDNILDPSSKLENTTIEQLWSI